jgi:heparin binding hemagglutinin HbhA
MSTTDTLKQYGETLVESSRTGLLAAIGAGDVAVERARSTVGIVRTRAEALPGEAQAQADLAVKEARIRAEQARARAAQATADARARAAQAAEQAGDAASSARSAVSSAVATVRPETVLATVSTLVGAARAQAVSTLVELAGRGEKVVEELRSQPLVRRVAGRAEQTVDAVAETVEDTLAETADTVEAASNEVTSVAQKIAARADKAVEEATSSTEAAAETTKRRVRATTAPKADDKGTGRGTKRTTTVETVEASTTPVPDPTAVPAKNTPAND